MNSSSYRSERTKSYEQSAMSSPSRSSNPFTPIASTSKFIQFPNANEFTKSIENEWEESVEAVKRRKFNDSAVKDTFGLLKMTGEVYKFIKVIAASILATPKQFASREFILNDLYLSQHELTKVSGWEQKVERSLSDGNCFRVMEGTLHEAGRRVELYGVVEGVRSIIEEQKEEELVGTGYIPLSERSERGLKVADWIPTPWLTIVLATLFHMVFTRGLLTLNGITRWIRSNYYYINSDLTPLTEVIVQEQFGIYCVKEVVPGLLGVRMDRFSLKQSYANLLNEYVEERQEMREMGGNDRRNYSYTTGFNPQSYLYKLLEKEYDHDLIDDFLSIFQHETIIDMEPVESNSSKMNLSHIMNQ